MLEFSTRITKDISDRKRKHRYWILHSRFSLGAKLYLKLTILTFWNKFAPRKRFSVENEKSEQHHWIRHSRIRLATKLSLKLTVLIFWTKFTQQGYFRSKAKKSEQHDLILNIGVRLGAICLCAIALVDQSRESWPSICANQNDLALLGRVRESWPYREPLVHVEWTEMLWHL